MEQVTPDKRQRTEEQNIRRIHQTQPASQQKQSSSNWATPKDTPSKEQQSTTDAPYKVTAADHIVWSSHKWGSPYGPAHSPYRPVYITNSLKNLMNITGSPAFTESNVVFHLCGKYGFTYGTAQKQESSGHEFEIVLASTNNMDCPLPWSPTKLSPEGKASIALMALTINKMDSVIRPTTHGRDTRVSNSMGCYTSADHPIFPGVRTDTFEKMKEVFQPILRDVMPTFEGSQVLTKYYSNQHLTPRSSYILKGRESVSLHQLLIRGEFRRGENINFTVRWDDI